MQSRPRLRAAATSTELERIEPQTFNGYRYGYPGIEEQSALLHYWQILRKRVWCVLATLGVVFAGSILVTLMTSKMYRASSRIAIFPENPNVLGFKDAENTWSETDNELALQTQASILQSNSLGFKVMNVMHLEQDPRFTNATSGRIAQKSAPGPDAAPYNAETVSLLNQFQAGLRVELVPGTRIVEVSYTHRNPYLAAEIVNTLDNTFIEENVRTRYESVSHTSEWLTQELTELRSKVEASEELLVRYQKEHGILGLDEKQNVVTAKLDELNKELTAAEVDRISKESNYQLNSAAENDSSERLSPGESPVLDKLLEQKADLDTQLAQITTQFGPAYPKVAELNNELKQVRDEITAEQTRMLRHSHGEYLAALQRVQMLKSAYEHQKQEANKLNESAIEYAALKRDADSNHQLYHDLLQRLKEAGISAGLKSSNIRIIDVAQVPRSPITPNLPRNLAFGFIFGLGGGLALALIRENLDTTVRNVEETGAISALPTLVTIPLQIPTTHGNGRKNLGLLHTAHRYSDAAALFSHTQPRSPAAESFRALRTSLLLSNLGSIPRVILVTSSLPREGKTTVSANLAVVTAQTGRKVLLVDGDLREPAIAKMFKLESEAGLSTLLSGAKTTDEVLISVHQLANLSILPAGVVPAQPAELLGSDAMKNFLIRWRNEFDHVIIDTPPCLSFTDAVLLSREVDGVLLVARWGQTSKAALRRASDLLLQVNASMLGVVLNGYDMRIVPLGGAYNSQYFVNASSDRRTPARQSS
jgi:polysaccharide biosynthesis transport protein